MPSVGMTFNFRQTADMIRSLSNPIDKMGKALVNRGALDATLAESRAFLIKRISGQLGRSQGDVAQCIRTTGNSIVVEDSVRSLAQDIESRVGQGLITRQGKTRISWKAARVVTFGDGEGMIAYYAKGHRPRARNPRKFGQKGNAYIKYAVTVDQAANAIMQPKAREGFIEFVQTEYEKQLNRALEHG
jgi:hypothetical protein